MFYKLDSSLESIGENFISVQLEGSRYYISEQHSCKTVQKQTLF